MVPLKYLELFRYQNLLIVIITQVLLRYGLLEPLNVALTLSDFGYLLLIIATVCLTASGNVINDVYDVETDLINKPHKVLVGRHISEASAYTAFIALNVIAVGIGFYMSNTIGYPGFSAVFIAISAILYMYASYLKRTIVVGNVVISLLVGFVILVVVIFDVMPAITAENMSEQTRAFSISLDYALFAFTINLIREMVKDQQDVKGDYNAGIKTLPIILGKERTNKVIVIVSIGAVVGLVYYIYNVLFQHTITVLYVLVLILGPLLYVTIRLWNASNYKDYKQISLILKIIMLTGLISLGLYQFILN